MNRQKGLTLLELILALTMLSIILVASGSLNLFVLRAANLNAEETKLQNELEYVFKDMEIHLSGARLDEVANASCEANNGNCIKLFAIDEDLGTWAPMSYEVSVGLDGISLIRCNYGTPEEPCDMRKMGSNLTHKVDNAGSPLPVFEIVDSNNKLVRVNLAAQTEKHKKIIRIEGSRMYFLRGVEP